MTNWEIRWFFKGPIPDDMRAWSENIGLEEKKHRIDVYLSFPDCVRTLSVKKSRGKFEIKICTESQEVTIKEQGIGGQLQLWTKCSLSLLDNEGDLFNLIDGQKYEVEKKRHNRKFEVNLETEMVNATNNHVENGVIVELTELEVNDTDWWTIGIDILGEKHTDVLKICGKLLFNESHQIGLTKESSMSYPEWISQL